MKFTRLTNHKAAMVTKPRSLHQGRTGRRRKSGGSVARAAATAKVCSTSRGAGAIGLLSAITPMAAIRRTAQNRAASEKPLARVAVAKNNTLPDTAMLAPTTAIPPPCGVGTLCDERAFGFGTAYRASQGLNATISDALSVAATAKIASAAIAVRAVRHSDPIHDCNLVRTALAGKRNFRNVGWNLKTRFAICRMSATSIARFNGTFLVRLADWFAVAAAISLPWSTTAVGIAIAAWLIVLLPTLGAAAVRRQLDTAAGGLPVVLWCLGLIGMLWANVGWHDRFAGLDSFHRLLVIPLLLVQFRRSENGRWVVCGFFLSSIALLIASYAIVLVLGHDWRGVFGVPVHDTIFQGSIFLICGFGALGYAGSAPNKRTGAGRIAIAAIGALFLINFAFATTSRAALVIAPLLLLLLGWRLFRWKGILAAVMTGLSIGAAVWFASPVLRSRIATSITEMQEYRAFNKATSAGEHLAFLKESAAIIVSAPIIGHGTGSIPGEFRRVTAGNSGVSGQPTVNPHNQTFAVAIQLGAAGAIVLWAMWIAHLALFRGESVVAWLGLVVVVENILSSTVHSHLFDFNNGWLYVFGVGVLGGTILGRRDGGSTKN
jgi:O-antigen ligase